MRIFKNMASIGRHYLRIDGPYEEKYHYSDPHVTMSPQEIYEAYNAGIPSAGHFIPPGFYEDPQEYQKRSDELDALTEKFTLNDLKFIISKYWIPRSNFRSYQQWMSNQVIPRMHYLNSNRPINDENKRMFIIGWLIDMGWDPTHRWTCVPPDAPYDDIKLVMNGIWDMLNHSTYPRIKNEYMKLFRMNAHRLHQFIDMVDRIIPHGPDQIEFFMVEREKKMIAHLVWLAKTDSRVYEFFKAKIMDEIDHNIALSMAINDPFMTYDERLNRDLMLNTQPTRGCPEFGHEGHDRIRDSIVGEHVPPADFEVARSKLLDHYYRKGNCFVEDRILMLYSDFLDKGKEECMDTIDIIQTKLPTVWKKIESLYVGKCDLPMLAAICDMVITVHDKEVRKARNTRGDVVRRCIEFVTELRYVVNNVKKRVNDNGYGKVKASDINLLGALRIISSDPKAVEDIGRLFRVFGEQDPKHNPKIVAHLTEMAVDVANNIERPIKDPEDFLLRKEQVRNPKNRVAELLGIPDEIDSVINDDSERGHRRAKKLPANLEQDLVSMAQREEMERIRQHSRNSTYGLFRAMDTYLGELDTKQMNYSQEKGRDIFRSALESRYSKSLDKRLEDFIDKSDISVRESGIDLSDATDVELVEIVDKTFTEEGRQYISDLLTKFNAGAKNNYDETQGKEKVKDRLELLRTNIEEILDSGDPDYVIDGRGKPGSFVPDETALTKDELYELLSSMSQNDLVEYIDNNLEDETCDMLANLVLKKGYDMEDIRKILLDNIDDLVEDEDEDDEGDESYDEEELEKMLSVLAKTINDMSSTELNEFAYLFLTPEDYQGRVARAIKRNRKLSEVKQLVFSIIAEEYDVGEVINEINQLVNAMDGVKEADEEDDEIDFSDKSALRKAIFDDVMQGQEGGGSRPSLGAEKREFVEWAVDTIVGLDEEKAYETVADMDALEFSKLKRDINRGIKSGRIKVYKPDDSDDYDGSNLGANVNLVRALRNAKLRATTDDDEDEMISDKEAERRVKRLLYSR